MATMKIYYTFGWGLETKEYRFKNNAEMKLNADKIINAYKGREITLLGQTNKVAIEKVAYTYESGKKFLAFA